MPDTRPGIIFDNKGVCLPCRWSEKKKKLIGEVEKKISQKFAVGRKRFPKINGAVFWE